MAIVGIYAVRWFFTYGDTIFFAEAGQRLSLRLRDAIYTHLQGCPCATSTSSGPAR